MIFAPRKLNSASVAANKKKAENFLTQLVRRPHRSSVLSILTRLSFGLKTPSNFRQRILRLFGLLLCRFRGRESRFPSSWLILWLFNEKGFLLFSLVFAYRSRKASARERFHSQKKKAKRLFRIHSFDRRQIQIRRNSNAPIRLGWTAPGGLLAWT